MNTVAGSQAFIGIIYLIASALFILALRWMNAPPTARRGIRVLVIAPTRELVLQIDENVRAYARHLPLKVATVFGGVGENARPTSPRAEPASDPSLTSTSSGARRLAATRGTSDEDVTFNAGAGTVAVGAVGNGDEINTVPYDRGAVGMVEMALASLSEKKVVELDDERRAAMVSNLMVVLCGERDTQPVVNTGTLYQ